MVHLSEIKQIDPFPRRAAYPLTIRLVVIMCACYWTLLGLGPDDCLQNHLRTLTR